MKRLGFLHTAKVNVDLFKQLMAGEGVAHRHVLRDDLLNQAQAEGELTPAIQSETETLLQELAGSSDGVLLTCSTLGPAADALNLPNVLRVDRALAEQAVADGGKVAVLVAVETTVAPTRELFEEVAAETGAEIEMVMVEGAWQHFQAGDMDGYIAKIAECARAQSADVVALAQASMAEAVSFALEKKVLSSPQAGLAAVSKLTA